jgi:hypothetical protein
VADRQDFDREVLTSLPRSRPVRRSAKRSASPGARATGQAGAATAAKPGAAKTGARAAKRKPAAARARPAAKAPPTRAASGATKTATKTATEARTSAEPPHVAPKRKVPPAGYAVPSSRADHPAASGAAELIGTTLQAAAELAQIGLTVGRQTLQSMVDRLPKP